jgi:DNA-binding FadR family transcriptional regulator
MGGPFEQNATKRRMGQHRQQNIFQQTQKLEIVLSLHRALAELCLKGDEEAGKSLYNI